MDSESRRSFDLITKFAHDVKHHVMIAEELAKALRNAERSEQPRVLGRLERTLRRLFVETSSILLTGKFEAGLLTISPLELQLNDVIRECLEEMRILFESSGQSVELKTSENLPTIHADPALLPNVVNNLLDNAMKYGGTAKPVVIETLLDGSAGEVCLRVRSFGTPLDPAEGERLFQRFERGSNAAGRPGTGLGLYLVRQIVAAHGGSVVLLACGGEETSVEVRLPVGK